MRGEREEREIERGWETESNRERRKREKENERAAVAKRDGAIDGATRATRRTI